MWGSRDAAILGAKLAGAAKIIGVVIDPTKLTWGKDFGATHTIGSSKTDPVEAIRELTGGFGANVTIEAVGHPDVMRQAFFARDLTGTLVQAGVPNPAMMIELPRFEFYAPGGALKPAYGDCLPTRDFPMLIHLYLRRLDLDRFVSERIGLDDVEDAFHKMKQGKVLRSVVVMN